MTGPEVTALVQKLLPGGPGILFWNTGVIFCNNYLVFARTARPRHTFYGTLYKIQNSINASEFLSFANKTVLGLPFSGRRPRGAISSLPESDRQQTADALRPGRLKNTWPARPPEQARRAAFQKIQMGTSSGQPPTGFFQNTRPHTPGWYLSAEVCGPQPPPP